MSTSFVKTLGKTLCFCLAALAMDLIWGYAGILSLGHMAFFALGGYMVGMWLMYARTENIVVQALSGGPLPATAEEIRQGIGTQIFGVVGGSEMPAIWGFAHSLPLQLMLVVLVPGVLALVFGWLAFRSRVTGVYLSILTQAMTLALSLYLFQNDFWVCAATTGCRACRTCRGWRMSGRTGCRSGSSGCRRWRWGWPIFCCPGRFLASLVR